MQILRAAERTTNNPLVQDDIQVVLNAYPHNVLWTWGHFCHIFDLHMLGEESGRKHLESMGVVQQELDTYWCSGPARIAVGLSAPQLVMTHSPAQPDANGLPLQTERRYRLTDVVEAMPKPEDIREAYLHQPSYQQEGHSYA